TARLWETASPQEPLGRWYLNDGGQVSELRPPTFALSPDGKALLRAVEGLNLEGRGPEPIVVEVQDVTADERIGAPLQVKRVTAAAFSPDGQRALVGASGQAEPGKDAALWLWEGGRWKPTGPPGVRHGAVVFIAFGPGGRTVLLGDADGSARL